RALASQGYHLVLVSRRPAKLEALADTLANDFGVRARVVASDLSVPGAAAGLVEALGDLDVGLLISNAGAARMGGFLQNTLQDLSADLYLNALSHMQLAQAFGSRLRSNGRPGGIVLVSSTAALQPMALGGNYAAAKAYITTLGESLHREFREIDVDVSVLLPGPTNTHGLNHRDDIAMGQLPMAAMSVEQLVREGLSALRARRASHIAGFMNRWMARLMPRRLMASMFSFMLRKNAAPHLLPTSPIANARRRVATGQGAA
ncbi:MAG: SDR family NAD(P)-dependent oxidoreductase, partial [Myxococcota bacterium]